MGLIRINAERMAAASEMGGCPECGGCDGNVNLRKLNVAMCHLHRCMWVWGEGLVSTPDHMTWDDLERSFETQVGGYRWVEPADVAMSGELEDEAVPGNTSPAAPAALAAV